MGIALVLAYDYADLTGRMQDCFHKEELSVSITRSKPFAQYLDSFGGKKAYNKGEDTYMQAYCLTETKTIRK